MYKIDNPYCVHVGFKYKIIEPVYDDYDEGLEPETHIYEVVAKTNNGLLVNLDGDTHELNYQYLQTCEIYEIH